MTSDFFHDLTIYHWLLLNISAIVIGFAKTGIAGIAILAVPIFAEIFPAEQSAGILLPLLCFGDIMAVAYYRRHADWQKIMTLIPWVAVGVTSATLVYFFASRDGSFLQLFLKDYMKPIIGLVVVIVLGLSLWREKHQQVSTSTAVAVSTGVAAGFTSMLANAAGPIMNIYFLAMKLPKQVFIGTAAWFFLIINYTKLPLMAVSAGSISSASLKMNIMLIPAIIIGGFLGVKVLKYIPEASFKRVIQVLIFAACLNLIFF